MRFSNAFGSCSQTRLCRNTRIVFIPMLSAHPSSRSIVVGSYVSACHISNSLIAVEGKKFAPTTPRLLCVPGFCLVLCPALLRH